MKEIDQLCRKYEVKELAVFGSALRNDFSDDSDVDFLVSFIDNDASPWMGKFTDVKEDLERLLHRSVDVVDQRGIEQSRNPYRKSRILKSARVVYAR